MKRCKLCRVNKEDTAFYKSKGYVSQPCKECVNKFNRENRKKNKPELKQCTSIAERKHQRRMASVKVVYNLTETDLQNMLLAQQGCCKICGTDFGLIDTSSIYMRTYDIEHNHHTGEIRGLVCRRCNVNLRYEDLAYSYI